MRQSMYSSSAGPFNWVDVWFSTTGARELLLIPWLILTMTNWNLFLTSEYSHCFDSLQGTLLGHFSFYCHGEGQIGNGFQTGTMSPLNILSLRC